jgi:hypothetical protein
MMRMRKKIKERLGQGYVSVMLLGTMFTYIWFISVFWEIVFFLFRNFSHIIRERNLNIEKNPPGLFGDIFAYKVIASILLWRLILDFHSIYLIAKKCKLKWYDFLDGSWNSGPNSFFDRVSNHIFFYVPGVIKSEEENN